MINSHDYHFKVNCLKQIDMLLRKAGINARPLRYIECTTLSTFVLEFEGSSSDLKKHECEFKNYLGDRVSIKSKEGRAYITLPKPSPEILPLSYILNSPFYHECPGKLKIALGENVEGAKVVGDLERWIHVLVAGEIGSGKSVFLHNVIASLITNYDISEFQLVLIDTKRVEFVIYEGLAHLMKPIAYEIEDAEAILKWLVSEMNRRFKLLQTHRCRNIQAFNRTHEPLPRIVAIIDEFANLTQDSSKSKKYIIKLAQLSRAVGIHLVLATQRPSVDVVDPLIKANISTRIAFAVSDAVNSRVILDQNGAEELIGKGDMLLKDQDGVMRIQGAFISENEIEELIAPYIIENQFIEGEIDHDNVSEEIELEDGIELEEELDEDERDFNEAYENAIEKVLEKGRCSQWFIKRNIGCGNTLADKIIEKLQDEQIIGEYDKKTKSYEILVAKEDFE